MLRIAVKTEHDTVESIKTFLERAIGEEEDVRFEAEGPPMRVRGVDPTVLVAVVGAAGTAFGALISGLLQYAASKESAKIEISGSKGRKVVITGNTSLERVREYVKVAQEIDVDSIEICKD